MPWQLPGLLEEGYVVGQQPRPLADRKSLATLKAELNKIEPAPSEKTCIQNVQVTWGRIKAETLDNQMCGMLERMQECSRLYGGHIGK